MLCTLVTNVSAQITEVEKHPQKDTVRVRLLNQLSRSFFPKDAAKTAQYAHEALKLSDSLHFKTGIMWATRNLALAENIKGNLEKQMDLTVSALKLADELDDNYAVGVLNTDMGNILVEQDQPRQALRYQKKALRIKQALKQPAEIARTLNSIGSSYIRLNKPDSALHFLLESERIKLSLNDHAGLAITYENIGLVYTLKQQYSLALPYFEISEQYYKESDNINGLVKAHLNMGFTKTMLRKYEEAEQHLAEAAQLNSHLKNMKNTLIYHKNMATLDSARGNYSAALANYKQFSRMNEQMFSVEKTKFIANTKEKYESEKKQHENKLLRKEQQLHLATIKQQRILVIFCTMLLLGLFIITAVLYLMYRRQQELYSQLNHRNTQVQQQNKIIMEQNAALESGSQVKDKIFSVISHDLRSPLAILEGLLFLLRDDKMSEEQFRIFSHELWRDMKNTAYMMDNLLQWASSQMKGIHVTPDDFDISTILKSEFELLQSLAKQKEITLTHELQRPIMVYADPDMIRLVLRNLISNAIKFTPINGSVNINYLLLPDKIELIVQDNGLGIAATDQAKVFSNIYYSTNGTRNEKGCGLGLPLSKDFIERNNGRIWFHSAAGKGTSFHFTLPLSSEEENLGRGYTIIVKDNQESVVSN
ncbi:tetratricopeptide repeat-containing sensor histidine kinase [Chitinophaga filiformis]|uniref:tetratricopeptide repeat-containing sensor histidine kinase n=1 Tax=Chitinophaga filiformis TaxID=104663 RepID=UPI001F409C60|nr:tetratricopeptide repeat-containing sensor histidine kinase [Chitinophaga filiformis]MCF6405915.1 tetratricopeptide repeat-containing sensor histidine kinase [Chitinophaga filiformis]